MRTFAIFAVLMGAVGCASSPVHAVQTAAAMKECVNCTATQMQTMAKNLPVGYHFIYDLAHNVIRKYDVYMDSTCANQPVIRSSTLDGDETQKDRNGIDCGSFKAADEVPVNPSAQNIFNNLHLTWVNNRPLADTQTAIGTMPPGFDPSKIAWDYPQGQFVSFESFLRNQVFNTKANANAFAQSMGDFIFGVSFAVNSVDVGNPPQVLLVHITLDRNDATVYLKICDNTDVCVTYDIKILNGQISQMIYKGTFDSENMMLPSQSGATPGQLLGWHWQHASDGDHFADMLHQRSGLPVPQHQGCGSDFHYALQVARVNGVVDSMSWSCIPN